MFVIGFLDAVLDFKSFYRLSEDSEHFFVLGFLGLEELGRLFTKLSRRHLSAHASLMVGVLILVNGSLQFELSTLVDLIDHCSENTSY